MEEIKSGEQPVENLKNVQSGIVEDIEKGTACLNENAGSLGKFKDADSLLSAYNCLQAEFTKKCQKLSELSKQMEELNANNNANFNAENNAEKNFEIGLDGQNLKAEQNENLAEQNMKSENLNLKEVKDNISLTGGELSKSSGNSENEKAENLPIFESKDWKDKVSAFLIENSEAKQYSGEIAKEIMENKELQSSPYALELAWGKVMQKEFKSPKVLAADKTFITEQILSRDEIKEQVLNEYFKNLQKNKIPTLISNSGSVATVTHKQPTTMQEAKQAMERLFNLKGQ